MAKTAIIFTPKFYRHKTGLGHPESSRRLKAIINELKSLNLSSAASNCEFVEPESATIRQLELVHSLEHIKLVERICRCGGGLLDLGDTVVSPESFDVARHAVGGAIKAVDLVLSGKFKNAFALLRPPGHHAGSYYGMGFCVFNNIAVAGAHLAKKHGLKRVAVLDIDAHHGNGTQEIFYRTKKVLYISLHEDPREFPGTGFVDEVGESEGLGYSVNIPFPLRVGDKAFLQAFDDIVIPIIREYSPQFILASVGYDGYWGDPVAQLNLSASVYGLVFQRVLDFAATVCEGRFAAVLEGGYSLRKLGKLVALSLSKMAPFPYEMKDEMPTESSKTAKQAGKIIAEVKKVQSAFWRLKS